jgi:hypothetical protein
VLGISVGTYSVIFKKKNFKISNSAPAGTQVVRKGLREVTKRSREDVRETRDVQDERFGI